MDDSGPLQAKSLLGRMARRSKMSIFGVAGSENSYQPRRPSIVGLLSRSKKRMQKFQETGRRQTDSEDEQEDDMSEEQPSARLGSREEHHRTCIRDVDFTCSQMTRVNIASEEFGFFTAKETERLARLLDAAGDGFVLRGWRCLFDHEGNLNIPFMKFCKVSVEIGFVKRTDELYSMPREFTNITLMHVNPQLGALLESFRQWILLRYHGHGGFFDTIDLKQNNSITEACFIDSCLNEGFSATEYELDELYSCCDWEGRGFITRDDIVFLENDVTVKERELLQIRLRKQYEFDKYLVEHYSKEMVNPLPPSHRHAVRPWIAKQFEEMPEVQRQVRANHEKNRLRKGLEMRLGFIRLLRKMHGNEITAWRRMMDVEGKFSISEARFRQLCRQVDFSGDINALWYSFDPDYHTGTLSLEKLSPHAAKVLASFRSWALRTFGSCVDLWQSPECLARRGTSHPHREGETVISRHMRVASFCQFLIVHNCSIEQGEQTISKSMRRFISYCLDLGGGGFILRSDLEWLDKWEPSEWLAAQPDETAWLALRGALLQKSGHLSKAWRFELDSEGFNRLSWVGFRDACHRLKFDGDVGAAWRWLDKDHIGWMSLASIDADSSAILESFKEWAEMRFGSVQAAFKTIGGGSTNTAISCHELRIASHKFKWFGDAQLLFECLTNNGSQVFYKDAAFLNTWRMSDQENADLLKTTMDTLWKEILEMRPTVRILPGWKPSLAVCEGGLQEVPGLKALAPSLLALFNTSEGGVQSRRGSTVAESCAVDSSGYTALGAYAARVVTPVLEGSALKGEKSTKRSSPKKMVKSSSHPASFSRSCGSPEACPNARLGKFSKAAGPARKKDLIDSISAHHSLDQDTAEYL